MAKYCYILRSCNPKEYEDITNLCLEALIPDIGESVYINADPSKLYVIEFVGVDICICEKELPPYTVSKEKCLLETKPKCFLIINCKDGKELQVCLTGVAGIGLVVEIKELEGCWRIEKEVEEGETQLAVSKVHTDCETCLGVEKIYYLIVDCSEPTRTFEVEIIGTAVNIGDVITIAEYKGCWEVKDRAEQSTQTVTLLGIYKDCLDCNGVQPKYYRLETCDGKQTNTVQLIGGTVNIGDVIMVAENKDCWKVIAEVQEAVNVFTYSSTLQDCSECEPPSEDCKEDGERTIAYATMVRLPEPPIPDKGFKECCYTNLVLAHQTDSDPYKNDFTGFYFQKQTSGDDCDFILHELATGNTYALNNGTYGVFKDFGSITGNGDLTTYIVQWRKVLAVLGTGLYQVERAITVAGLTFSMMSNTFTLEQFTNVTADKTIRLDASMDGTMVHLGVDFKNSEFETSIRTFGFFGRRNPKYKQDNLVKRNYDTVQISMSQENEYEMQTGLIPECITTEIYDFILFGNELFASDYNLINHSYKFRLHEVELDKNKGGKYYTTNRDSRINVTFKDRVKNKRKINC